MVTVAMIFIILHQGCAKPLSAQQALPFKIDTVYYQTWVGGIEGAGSGYNLFLKTAEPLPENVVLTAVYFNNNQAVWEQNKQEPLLFVAHLKNDLRPRESFILHKDVTQEYGNESPKKQPQYELAADEAMIFYTVDGQKKMSKISGIFEKPKNPDPRMRN
ncbi:MAG: hypothetical protein RQ735_07830 [Flavobacteriaceae bacterium]|nr:hypothetical protein [Flavobacteriaceae bacterium]